MCRPLIPWLKSLGLHLYFRSKDGTLKPPNSWQNGQKPFAEWVASGVPAFGKVTIGRRASRRASRLATKTPPLKGISGVENASQPCKGCAGLLLNRPRSYGD